jgi:hypothetical protein
VIERRVKSLSQGRIARLDLDFVQNVAPTLRRGGHRCLEIPSGNLGGQIFPGAFEAHGGKADLHEHRLARIVEIEAGLHANALAFTRVGGQRLAVHVDRPCVERP